MSTAINSRPLLFTEIEITARGTDSAGKKRVFRMTHKLVDHSSLSLSQSRPVKMKGKKMIPSEYVFHNIHFITSSEA